MKQKKHKRQLLPCQDKPLFEVLEDAQALLNYAKSEKNIVIVESKIHLGDLDLTVYDICQRRGYHEDKVLAENPSMYHNIRRGLSIVFYEQKYALLRRGLKKFFDIEMGCKKSHINKTLDGYTFEEVRKQSNCIRIFKMEKANGENCQISFFKPANAWIVCSKNVSIICRNEADTALYKESRHQLAILIAQAWFKSLNEQIQSFFEKSANITLVGEYVGNNQYQHFVKYEQIQLRFFAVVPAEGIQTCVYPEDAFELFQKMGLSSVRMETLDANSQEELEKRLEQMSEEILLKPITEEGEGCVLYFGNVQTRECLSLGKLKTVEYRLYRKIREKLKLFLNSDANVSLQKLLADYTEQSKELVKEKIIEVRKYQDFLSESLHVLDSVKKKNDDGNLKPRLEKLLQTRFIDFRVILESSQTSLEEKCQQVEQIVNKL